MTESLELATSAEPPAGPGTRSAATHSPPTALTMGVEEELHVVDRGTRELVPRGPEILRRLPDDSYAAELHRSVVETNTPVCTGLDELRGHLVRLRWDTSYPALPMEVQAVSPRLNGTPWDLEFVRFDETPPAP